MKNRISIFYIFSITLILSSCETEIGPEEIVKQYLTHLQNGECDKALALEVDRGYNQSVEFECEPYEGEINSIDCETQEESSSCACYETRADGRLELYEYDVKKVDGQWKVAAVHKLD